MRKATKAGGRNESGDGRAISQSRWRTRVSMACVRAWGLRACVRGRGGRACTGVEVAGDTDLVVLADRLEPVSQLEAQERIRAESCSAVMGATVRKKNGFGAAWQAGRTGEAHELGERHELRTAQVVEGELVSEEAGELDDARRVHASARIGTQLGRTSQHNAGGMRRGQGGGMCRERREAWACTLPRRSLKCLEAAASLLWRAMSSMVSWKNLAI